MAHPVAKITRLSLDGYGARRAGSFSGKTPHIVVPPSGPPKFEGFRKNLGKLMR